MFIRGVSSIMELHGAEGDYSFLNVVPLLWHLDKSEQVDVPVKSGGPLFFGPLYMTQERGAGDVLSMKSSHVHH